MSDERHDDPANWKFGIFYFNKKDERIVLPKRNGMLGWTLNFANLYTYLLILGIIAVVLIVSLLG